MRRISIACALLMFGCVERRGELEVDYTEEVAQICAGYCTTGLVCIDQPLLGYDDCIETCNQPGTLHEDSECGEAFRAYFGCMGRTETCEVWDAANEGVCKEEVAKMTELKCGGREEDG